MVTGLLRIWLVLAGGWYLMLYAMFSGSSAGLIGTTEPNGLTPLMDRPDLLSVPFWLLGAGAAIIWALRGFRA